MKNSFFKSPFFHIILFLLTLVTTTIAGAKFITGNLLAFNPDIDLDWTNLRKGLAYSVPFLFILSAHEFGHYFMALYHRIKTTLPFYIPLPILGIGTLGAVIRIKEPILSKKIFFDIGIAGPLAGFVVALLLLFYGFTHLPSKDYIFSIHPEYKEQFGLEFEKYAYNPVYLRKYDSLKFEQEQLKDSLRAASLKQTNWKRKEYNSQKVALIISLGDNILFYLFREYVASPQLMPHKYELIHYPLLLAGYLALFFTALNLIPIGQLDGGHILYGLLGYERSKLISGILFSGLVFYGGIGIVTMKEIVHDSSTLILKLPLYIGFLYFIFSRITEDRKSNLLIAVIIFTSQFLISYINPDYVGNNFWLLWAFILSKILGIYHPPALYEDPLDLKRKILGWISLIVFILCFTPQPLILEELAF